MDKISSKIEHSTVEVPAVRVRHYNQKTDEVEDGTVIEIKGNSYLVMPDYNLHLIVRWDKRNCDVVRCADIN